MWEAARDGPNSELSTARWTVRKELTLPERPLLGLESENSVSTLSAKGRCFSQERATLGVIAAPSHTTAPGPAPGPAQRSAAARAPPACAPAQGTGLLFWGLGQRKLWAGLWEGGTSPLRGGRCGSDCQDGGAMSWSCPRCLEPVYFGEARRVRGVCMGRGCRTGPGGRRSLSLARSPPCPVHGLWMQESRVSG